MGQHVYTATAVPANPIQTCLLTAKSRTQRSSASILSFSSYLAALLLLVLVIVLPSNPTNAAHAPPSAPVATARTRPSFFSRGRTSSVQEAPLSTNQPKAFSNVQDDDRWDTGRFLRAVVDAQVAQVSEEVNRVRAFITLPPGIVNTSRNPEEVAEQVGKLVVDVGMGYLQSAALGYAFGYGGAVMADDMTKRLGARFCGKTFAHKRGIKQAKQFGEFCAAFTAFEGILHVGRGISDKWNGILGSTAVGMYTTRNRALSAQLKNGLTFGGFNYVLSGFAGGKQQAEGGGTGAGSKGAGRDRPTWQGRKGPGGRRETEGKEKAGVRK